MPGLIAALLVLAQVGRDSPANPDSQASFNAISRQAAEARDANRLDDALAFYRKALELKPDWDEGLWNAGSIAYDQDKFAGCAPLFQHLATLQPDSTPAWTMSGLCAYGLRQYDSALKSFRQAERLGFKEPIELSRAGRLHFALVLTKTGSFEKALTVLTELTRLDRKTPDVTVAAGIAGLRKPWLPPEVPEADRAMIAEVGDAMSAAMELDPKEAIRKFEAALHDYPAAADIHFRFGAFLMQQDPDRGIAEIKKALALDPAHIPAMVGLTMIYIKDGNPEAAKEYAAMAVKTSPGDFATHVALGRALLAAEDPASAARELEVAVKLAPESPEARYNLASAYSRLGRHDDAEREQEQFKRLRKLIDSTHPQ